MERLEKVMRGMDPDEDDDAMVSDQVGGAGSDGVGNTSRVREDA